MPSFDSFPITYWVPIYCLCWLLTWALLTNRIRSSKLFLGLSFLLLFLLRLPGIVFNQEINPDESQMIAQAITLRYDPVFWRSVDGTTGGPLNTYLLTLAGMLGLPYDYTTARLVAYFLVVLILWFSYRTARLWFNETSARWALLPFIFMLGLTQIGDLIHYNSELIVVTLLTGAVYLYACMRIESKPALWRIGLIGLLLGMVPFSKLQGVPSAVVIGLFAGLDLVTRVRLNAENKYQRLAMLAGGGLAFLSVAMALIFTNGVFDSFQTFYIKANFGYGDSPTLKNQLLSLPAYLHAADEVLFIIVLIVLIWLVVFFQFRSQLIYRPHKRLGRQVAAFLSVAIIVSLFAILRTGMNYVHYFFFLFNPLLLLLAYSWQRLFDVQERMALQWKVATMSLFLFGFGVVTVNNYRASIPINLYPSDQQGGWQVPLSPVAKEVLKYSLPGERLVVWGWMCSYYVETRMPQGVAENHSQRSVLFKPMLKQYQERYIRDVLRSFPPVFVDAVGTHDLWLTDRLTQGHEIIEPLRRFIATNYCYMGMVDDTRIYVRRDRINSCPLEKLPVAFR